MSSEKLTKEQKEKLKSLEPQLQRAEETRNYEEAKRITFKIQQLLRPTRHETRLMQTKNRLFETAMECGELSIAIKGFLGVRRKVAETTRLYLEATSLLAICFLRKRDLKSARPYMVEALKCEKNIKSEAKRTQFKASLAKRFNDEALLSSLAIEGLENLNPERVQKDAGKLVCENTEDEILALLGSEVSSSTIEFVEEVNRESQKLLTFKEKRMLPAYVEIKEKRKLGKSVLSAFERILWKSLCDKESEVYKMWFTNGMKAVLDKKYITTAIIAALSGLSIGVYAIAVYATALIIKMGIEAFCDVHEPKNLMDLRK